MGTYIDLNLKEVLYTINLKNSIPSLPKTKVCVIRPTENFDKLGVKLLSFGKKLMRSLPTGIKQPRNAFIHLT